MVFPSVVFLACFAPLFILCYFLLPKKNLVFFLFSLVFFFWGETHYIGVLFAYILINYLFGLMVGSSEQPLRRTIWLSIGVAANCSLLAYYKYYYFFMTQAIPDIFGITISDIRHPHLPLGISYCTFHGISYLVDVYRKQVRHATAPLSIGLYISMFPHLVAGPIVRYHTIAKALVKRCITFGRIAFGMRLFVIGLAQKVLIADILGSVADKVFRMPLNAVDMMTSWVGTTAYTFQIYYDFCGYSMMAIGIGIIVGFRLPRNFRYPYFSQSITEFWRRWHISLSTWFRDYLYIPLGGNRQGTPRTLFNLFLVFFLCGLWHGAAYTFVCWGLYHGMLLILERLGLKTVLARLPRIARHVYALFAIMVGWVLFRADTLDQAGAIIASMCGLHQTVGAQRFLQLVNHEQMFAFFLAFLFATPLVEWVARHGWSWLRSRHRLTSRVGHAMRVGSLTILFVIALTYVLAGTYSPFLYFRF